MVADEDRKREKEDKRKSPSFLLQEQEPIFMPVHLSDGKQVLPQGSLSHKVSAE